MISIAAYNVIINVVFSFFLFIVMSIFGLWRYLTEDCELKIILLIINLFVLIIFVCSSLTLFSNTLPIYLKEVQFIK